MEAFPALSPISGRLRIEVVENVLQMQAEHARSLAVLETAQRAGAVYGTDAQLAEIWQLIAEAARRSSDHERAREALDHALHFARRSQDEALRGRILLDRSSLLVTTSNFDEAHGELDEAELALEHADDAPALAKLLANRALLLRRQGRLDEALSCFRRALDIARDRGLRREEAAVAHSMASMVRQGVSFDEALELCDIALAVDRQIGDRWNGAIALATKGTVYADMGRYEEARENLEAALDLQRYVNDWNGKGAISANLATTTMMLGELEVAEHYAQTSLEAFTTHQSAWGATWARLIRCDVRQLRYREPELVAADLEQALEYFDRTGEIDGRVAARVAQARNDVMLGNLVDARKRAEEARALLEEAGTEEEPSLQVQDLLAAIDVAEAGRSSETYAGWLIDRMPEKLRIAVEPSGQAAD